MNKPHVSMDAKAGSQRSGEPAFASTPDQGALPKAMRRKITLKDKLRILEATDVAHRPGEIGEILRREGFYASQLALWRKQRAAGTLEPRHRGPAPDPDALLRREIVDLRAKNERLTHKLQKAEALIDLQKKIAEIFASNFPIPLAGENCVRSGKPHLLRLSFFCHHRAIELLEVFDGQAIVVAGKDSRAGPKRPFGSGLLPAGRTRPGKFL